MLTRARLGLATAVLASGLCTAGAAHADECTPPRILFVVDASSSMLDEIPDGGGGSVVKWDAAEQAINDVLTAFPGNAQYGLMVFPSLAGACSTGEVLVDVDADTETEVTTTLGTVGQTIPVGGWYTPAGQTLMAASLYPNIIDDGYANYVIFVADGWQWCAVDCSGDPETCNCVTQDDCDLILDNYPDPGNPPFSDCPSCNAEGDGCYCVRSWPVYGTEGLTAAGVTTYVVGFGSGADARTLNQVADVGGTALPGCDPQSDDPSCYFQATYPADLTDALESIVQQVVTDDCLGECDIPGTRTCTASGWSDCDAPSVVDCMSTCDTPGTQECIGGTLTECSSEADCGSGGSAGGGPIAGSGGAEVGGAGGAAATGGATPTGGMGGLGNSEQESACGCRTVGRAPTNALGAMAWLLGLLGLRRVRRRRS